MRHAVVCRDWTGDGMGGRRVPVAAGTPVEVWFEWTDKDRRKWASVEVEPGERVTLPAGVLGEQPGEI